MTNKKYLKIYSWNVNGLRAIIRNGFSNWLDQESPDIIGLQEIKISNQDIDKNKSLARVGQVNGWDFPDYQEYWHPAQRPGYSGTAIFSKIKPLAIKQGFGDKNQILDNEGRVITAEFEKFYFINSYFPNSNHELSRLSFKEEFNENWLAYIKKLEKTKPIIACGDFNVAHQGIDLARPKDNIGKAGFTKEERSWMDKFINAELIDTFRLVNKNKIQYSWWSYRSNARARNIGWRIDYFLISAKLKERIKGAFIDDTIIGSDHAPIGLILEI